ncbi:MAG TPA: hypothetical protein V6C78_33500 [Crinalium sp.]
MGKCILAFQADANSIWSRLLGLLPGASRRDKIAEVSLLFPSLKMAIDSLFQEVPNLVLAQKIRRHIEKNLRSYEIQSPILLFLTNSLKDTLNSQSTPLKVSVGLLFSLPLYGAFMLISGAIFLSTSALISKEEAVSSPAALNTTMIVGEPRSLPSSNPPSNSAGQVGTKDNGSTASTSPSVPRVSIDALDKKGVDAVNLQENIVQVILVVSAGTLGSIVSILTRIREFRNENYRDSSLPIFVGLFKPIIGASFGVLIFALINSDLISISTLEGSQRKEERAFFFYSLAFVVGFSERLANDIVSRTENMFSNSPATPTVESLLMQQLSRKDLPPDVIQDLTGVLVQLSAKREISALPRETDGLSNLPASSPAPSEPTQEDV